MGRSRRWSWSDRPQAAALLAEAANPDRRFDAIVVGEYERAFHGDQFREIVTQLNDLGVEVWLPEAGGPVELDCPVHQALMVLLGAQAQAQREVARARQRAGRDAGASGAAGQIPWWPSALRVQACRCGQAPELPSQSVGQAVAEAGARSTHGVVAWL
ncbi:recombinase family protein [Lentzea sp. NPDC051213]|uniref:recombinase family protein n=1 Tax=Lentzea sp. NPDC051213 TaxID=3364126 RepID=UPI0037A77C0F